MTIIPNKGVNRVKREQRKWTKLINLALKGSMRYQSGEGGQTKYLAGLFCDRSGFLISVGSVSSICGSFELFCTVFLSVVSNCSLADRQDVQGHHGVFFCFGSSVELRCSIGSWYFM